jgi:hypothetical protein
MNENITPPAINPTSSLQKTPNEDGGFPCTPIHNTEKNMWKWEIASRTINKTGILDQSDTKIHKDTDDPSL